MSSLLQRKEFLIWAKGPAALDTMKTALCGHIKSVWTNCLETLTGDEIEHLEQFIKDMNGDCAKADFKKKEWTLRCGHSLCESILKKLLEIRHNKKSLHISWKTCCTTTQSKYGKDVFGSANIYERRRMICKTYYWSIANMFMFYGGEINDIPSSCPGDTDFALVLKMMKNCTLFEIDEIEIYDTVIAIGNRLFHTGQYNITEKAMESMIGKIIQLLEQVHQLPDCKQKHRDQITKGIQNLNDLKNRATFLISLDPDWNSMTVRALELQKEAIQCDISHRGTLQFDTAALENILAETNDRIEEYKDSDEWRKRMKEKEEERKRQEAMKKKMVEFEEWLKKSDKNLAGLYSEGAASALGGIFGPVGSSIGAVGGGVVGTAAEGVKKLFRW